MSKTGESLAVKKEPQRLLITPPLLPDESLMGYILRLTDQIGYYSPSCIFDIAGLKVNLRGGGWPILYSSDVDSPLFRQVLGLDSQEVEKLRQQVTCLVDAKFVGFDSPKICPACLKQSSHYRSVWDLLPFTACPFHEALLINICPGCRRQISWVRQAVSQCRCGVDWRDSELDKVDPASLKLPKLIHDLWSSGDEKISNSSKHRNPLYELELNDLFQVSSVVSNFYLSLTDSSMLINNRQASLHTAYTFTVSIFEDWPSGYFKFLEWIKENAGEKGINDFSMRVSKGCGRPSLFFVTATLEELIEGTWSTPSESVGLWLGVDRQFLKKREAGQLLAVDGEWVDELIAQRKIESFTRQDGETLIYAPSIVKLKSEISELTTHWRVADFLGITPREVMDLIRNGCLRALSGPEIDGFREWALSPSEVYALVRKIESKIHNAEPPRRDKISDGKEVSSYLNQYGLSASKFILDILNDEIIPVGELRGQGFTKFLFLTDQIVSYRRVRNPDDLLIDVFNREKFLERLDRERANRKGNSDEAKSKLPNELIRGIIQLLDRSWEKNDLIYFNKGIESFDIADLVSVAKKIFTRRQFHLCSRATL